MNMAFKKEHPYISVIIPVYNCPHGLKDTLKSVVDQNYPKDCYEILPIDNNSTDETPEIIKRYQKKFPNLVRGLSELDIQSSYAARNKGIKNANGDIFVFIDADMWVENDWLSKIAEEFQDGKPKYLGYNVEIVSEKENLVSLYNKYNGFQIKRFIEDHHFTGAGCLAASKEVFDEVGLFDHNLISGGDNEFGNRVFDAGFELDYTSKTKAYHPARDSFYSLIKKTFRIGRGVYQLKENHPDRYSYLERSVFNPRYLLPDPPHILKRVMDHDIGIKKLTFPLIKWMMRIVRHIGYVYEKGKKK